MHIQTHAQAIIAADIVTLWGTPLPEHAFLLRNIADVLANLHFSAAEQQLLLYAIVDNIKAFEQQHVFTHHTPNRAAHWSLHRPTHLHPLRYKLSMREGRYAA